MAQISVRMFYQSVIDDVIMNVREAFIDEGLDEQTLTELKQIWERKVVETKATERETPVTRSSHPVQLQSTRVAPGFSDLQSARVATVATDNMLAQTALHYTAHSGEESKSGASQNVPVKLNFTVPARLAQAGLQSLLATATGGGATVQIPQQLTQLLVPQQVATQSNPVQQATQQISGVQYQVLTTQQLQGQQFLALPVPQQPQKQPSTILQLDGANDDTSDEDEELSYSEADEEEEAEDSAVEDDPLNSNDDEESDEDPADVFDSDNVVVCQFDKIGRSKNRWKFHLKDGIMNLHGKDYVFHKVLGDSEW